MNLKKTLLYQTLQSHKRTLMLLAALELGQSLLLLAAAAILTCIVQNALLAGSGANALTPAPFLCLLAVLAGQQGLALPSRRLQHSLSQQARLKMRQRLHESSLGKPSPHLTALALEACDALDSYFTQVLPELLQLIIVLPVMFCAALALDTWTALLYIITVPIAPFLLYLIGQLTKKRSQQQWQKLTELTKGFRELLLGMISLKLAGRSKAQSQHLAQLTEGFAAASLQVLQLAFASSFMLELITTLSIALAAVSIGLRLLAGQLSFPPAFFLLLITPLFYQPLRQSGACFHALLTARTAEQELASCLTEAPPATGTHSQLQIPPAVRAENICYTYPGHSRPVLRNLSLTCPAGKATALTGPSGCGKSTLLKLLAVLDFPRQGGLWLNEADLTRLAPQSLARLISYLPQEPYIFAGTVAENVSLFQEVPPARIETALRLASLENWRQGLPQGLNTRLGAGGLNLSHGERKRLGLARIILQNRPIALLDEPTAGLDEATEQAVLKALRAFSHQRTLIIASHRPALLDWADKIIELEPAPDMKHQPV